MKTRRERGPVFGLIFMNDFYAVSSRETKDNHGASDHATKEIKEGSIKNEGQGRGCVTEH